MIEEAAAYPFLQEMLRQLAAGKKVDLDAKNADDGDNAGLHYIAQLEAGAIVPVLQERGADLNIKNKQGHTPLFTAFNRAETPTVLGFLLMFLYGSRSESIDFNVTCDHPTIPTIKNWTALHEAIERRSWGG